MGCVIVGAAMGGRLASLDALSLIWQASWIVQLVILLLALLSVASWAIIAVRWREISRAEQDSEAFLEIYHDGPLETAYSAARDLDHSPLAAIFLAAHVEMSRLARLEGKAAPTEFEETQLDMLSRKISWAASREALRLERGLPFLATTGSAAPFIGLFGTVVGIINAFQGIGRAGSASLAVVAPGIAEALIATAIGLFAAIPATVFYNFFVGKLRGILSAVDLFTEEFEGDLRRLAGAESTARRSGHGGGA